MIIALQIILSWTFLLLLLVLSLSGLFWACVLLLTDCMDCKVRTACDWRELRQWLDVFFCQWKVLKSIWGQFKYTKVIYFPLFSQNSGGFHQNHFTNSVCIYANAFPILNPTTTMNFPFYLYFSSVVNTLGFWVVSEIRKV